MNHWPFIIAAYALVTTGTLGVTLWSFVRMRVSENKAAALRKDDSA